MGLDMYLYVEKYVSRMDYDRDASGDLTATVRKEFSDLVETLGVANLIDSDSWTGMTVNVPVGYWRKANAIHNYIVETFADGRDECQEIGISRDGLHTLREFCKLAIDGYKQDGSTTFAEENLPTASGFFFGSTEYDEWYFRDLENTVEIIDRVLADEANDWFIYRASW